MGDLTVDVSTPVDEILHDILTVVNTVSQRMNVDFFVGGAMARDIILTHVHRIPMSRATRDVDIGIYLQSWDDFEALKQQLTDTGEFTVSPGEVHRLRYRGCVPLDLIPFGSISNDAQTISWPPDGDVVMNVTGFDDAYRSSVVVRVAKDLHVKTCTIPALAALKLIAWMDRYNITGKDASDLMMLIKHYGPNLMSDRLFDHDYELFEKYNHDQTLAGANLLGQDTAEVVQQHAAEQIMTFFANPDLIQRFIDQVIRESSGVMEAESLGVEFGAQLRAFEVGFRNNSES